MIPTVGAVAQLGERVNGIHEVSGSIPLGSTNPINSLHQNLAGVRSAETRARHVGGTSPNLFLDNSPVREDPCSDRSVLRPCAFIAFIGDVRRWRARLLAALQPAILLDGYLFERVELANARRRSRRLRH